MNKWECEYPGCFHWVVGCKGAIGLRAIGWYFEIGSSIFCPQHRPDQILCFENDENRGNLCSLCAADIEADKWQKVIENELRPTTRH